MLLEFRMKNYKSFVDEVVFSMIPAPKQKGLDYSILKEKVAGKERKGLSSAVIYGPNAAGKTNIIGAMDVLKAIVLRGNIRNGEEKNAPNPAANMLELIPNSDPLLVGPLSLGITFIADGKLFQYELSADLGGFCDAAYNRRIIAESLYVNEKMFFLRREGLEFGEFADYVDFMVNEFSQNSRSVQSIARHNLSEDELFLTNGFKTMFSAKLTNIILDWLQKKFIIIYRADALQLVRKLSDPKKQTVYVEMTTNEAAKLFGVNSNALGYMAPEDGSEAKLCSVFRSENGGIAMDANQFESYGTIRFINVFPLIIDAILHGGTLVIDEFDASIHPVALMSIINIFHNDDINQHHAQLIFNTHNPIFLNDNIFRRDEIKFVERDDETHVSTQYALSDFGTAGAQGVRRHDDYMSKYFISQYGAIKDIDFTPIFEKLIHQREQVK